MSIPRPPWLGHASSSCNSCDAAEGLKNSARSVCRVQGDCCLPEAYPCLGSAHVLIERTFAWPCISNERRDCRAAEEAETSSKRICRVQGIAVCWSADSVYYIPLNPAAPGAAKFVGGMMGGKRAQKITYDLKSQMAALLAGEVACACITLHVLQPESLLSPSLASIFG